MRALRAVALTGAVPARERPRATGTVLGATGVLVAFPSVLVRAVRR